MKNLYLLFLLPLLMVCAHDMRATHVMGTHVSYECIGRDTVVFYFHMYMDCYGLVGLGGPPPGQLPMPYILINPKVPGSTCTDPVTISNWQLISYTEITPVCASVITGCRVFPFGAPTAIHGALDYLATTTIDFSNTGCTEYDISWLTCCRNGLITSGAANDGMFSSVNLSLNPCNSSPQFLHDPDTYICTGKPTVVSYQAYDPDGDSLVYRLGPCFVGRNTTIGYDPGFSPTSPLGPSWNISVNSQTGDLSILPNPGNQVIGVICVEVEEFRNGISLGTTSSDVQVNVMNCGGNNPPVLDNFSLVSGAMSSRDYVVQACVGNSFSVSLRAFEPDLGDTLTIEIDSTAVPGLNVAMMGTNPRMIGLNWSPTAIGRFHIPIKATDQYCPIPGKANRTIVVEVSKFCIDANITYAACDSSNGSIQVTSFFGGRSPYQYRWSTGDTTSGISGLKPGLYGLTVTDQSGDSLNRTFTLQGSNMVITPSFIQPGCNDTLGAINLSIAGGTAPYTYQWNTGDTSAFLLNTTAGNGYSVTVFDANGCPRNGAWKIPYPDSCFNIVYGKAFYDVNKNCQYDAGEPPMANMRVHLQSSWSVLTDINGEYSLPSYHADTTVFLYADTTNPYKRPHCLSNGIDSIRMDSLGMLIKRNIAYAIDSVHDISTIYSPGGSRPGFDNRILVFAQNIGTLPSAGTLIWKYDTMFNFQRTEPMYDRYDPVKRTLEWDFPKLASGTIFTARVYSKISRNASLGTPIHDTSWVVNASNDTMLANNRFVMPREMTGSFDPNDKRAFPFQREDEGWLLPEEENIVYTVRFQNTGNDTAFFVVIRDTLDDSILDINTLQMIGASHPYTMELRDDRYLTVRFDNILLPDSTTNLAESQGFVSFSLDRKKGLLPGDEIKNKAAIYFDFNKPVITNTCLRTMALPMQISRKDSSSICEGDSITIKVESGVPPFTFLWSNGDLETDTKSRSASWAPDSSGRYTVTISDATTLSVDYTFDVQVDGAPDATFATSYPLPHWVDFAGKAGHAYWHWDFGDGTTAKGKDAYHYYLNGGQYQVQLIVGNSCGADTSYETIGLTVGLDPTAFARSVSVAPNPVTSTSEIRFANPRQKPFGLKLFDLQGREVRSYPTTQGESFLIEKGTLKPGVYLYMLDGPVRHYGRIVVI
ncbi:MAG: PKD domain-containing protein [Bacteroidia bacterium]